MHFKYIPYILEKRKKVKQVLNEEEQEFFNLNKKLFS